MSTEEGNLLPQYCTRQSERYISKTLRDGTTLVSNVKSAAAVRERDRLQRQAECRKLRLSKLEQESRISDEHFKEITEKWLLTLNQKVPQDTFEKLSMQKIACDAVVEEKNELIQSLKAELNEKDQEFVRSLEQQQEDFVIITQRMEDQVQHMCNTYKEELDKIEKVYVNEWNAAFCKHNKAWDEFVDKIALKGEEQCCARSAIADQNREQLENFRKQQAQVYRELKIKLAADIDVMEQQIRKMKATYLLNQEKLAYEYKVIRKRDEECAILKSQQRRTLNKLQDAITCRKQALASFQKQYSNKLRHLDYEIKRLGEQISSQEDKIKHFEAVYLGKFVKLWGFNEWQVRCLATKILLVDKRISEQLLGVPWEPPKCSDAPKDTFPVKLPSSSSFDNNHSEGKLEEVEEKDGSRIMSQSIPVHKMREILFALAEGAHFLIDVQVLALLQRVEMTQQTMIRLDLLFSVLGIRSEEEVKDLVRCYHRNQVKLSRSLSLSETCDVSRVVRVTKSHCVTRRSSTSQIDHSNLVVKALTDFLGERQTKLRELQHIKITDEKPADNVWNKDEIEAYWCRYLRVVSPDKEMVWSMLMQTLQKHRITVLERSNVEKVNGKLRKQNEELNDLIQKCLHMKLTSRKL